MNREGAETYLRLLAEAKMRGALAHVADRSWRSPPGGGRMGIMLVAERELRRMRSSGSS